MRSSVVLAVGLMGILTLIPACNARTGSADAVAIGAACDRWIMALADRGPLPDNVLLPDDRARPRIDIRAFSPEDRNTVLAAYRRACVDVAAVDGSGVTAAYLDGCRDALLAVQGGPVALPLACVPPPGTHADGQGCVADHQCVSLHCAGSNPAAGTCGTCAPALRDRASCTGDCGFGYVCATEIIPGAHSGPTLCSARGTFSGSNDHCIGVACGGGTFCEYATGACLSQRVEGGPCFADSQCAAGLSCKRGSCARPLPLGSVCDVDIDCEIDAYCKPSNPPPGPGGPGTCVSAAPPGAACDDWYVQCGRGGAACGSTCGGARQCTIPSSDFAGAPPGATATGSGCSIGSNQPCGACPRLVAEGAACGPDVTCGPRSSCVDGAYRPDTLGCH